MAATLEQERTSDKVIHILDNEFSTASSQKQQELVEINRRVQDTLLKLDYITQIIHEKSFSPIDVNELERLQSPLLDFETAVSYEDKPDSEITGVHCKTQLPTEEFSFDTESLGAGIFDTDCDNTATVQAEHSDVLTEKTVIMGNTSKYFINQSDSDGATHKWMVYVRGVGNEDISEYIKSVWFLLDPSYRPNDCIHITSPPFQLVRRGWGEFPLRIRIVFQNSLNKPVDVIHDLALDQTRTGQQARGSEKLVRLNLYLQNCSVSPVCPESAPKLSESATESRLTLAQHDHTYTCSQQPVVCSTSHTHQTSGIPGEDPIEHCLEELVGRVPLIGTPTEDQPFSAACLQEYLSWSKVKQNACEWMRAVALNRLVHSALHFPPSVSVISTRNVLNWCRAQGYTPLLNTVYCGVCGKSGYGDRCCDKNVRSIQSLSNVVTVFKSILESDQDQPSSVDPEFSLPCTSILISDAFLPVDSPDDCSSKDTCGESTLIIRPILQQIQLDAKLPECPMLADTCSSLLLEAAQSFMKHILLQSLSVAQSEEEHVHSVNHIVPMHIYQSLCKHPYQFLSNHGQGLQPM